MPSGAAIWTLLAPDAGAEKPLDALEAMGSKPQAEKVATLARVVIIDEGFSGVQDLHG
jgi:hypothetical protein